MIRAVLLILVFAGLLYRYPVLRIRGFSLNKNYLIFLLKFFCGFLLFQFYNLHYGGGDMQSFLNDSNRISEWLLKKPSASVYVLLGWGTADAETLRFLGGLTFWFDKGFENYYSDSRSLLRTLLYLRPLSGGQVESVLVLMNVLAWLGLKIVVNSACDFLKTDDRLLVAGLMLPDILLWSSGILKETLLFFAMGLLLSQIVHFWKGNRTWVLPALSLFIAFQIKIYVVLSLIPILVLGLFPKLRSPFGMYSGVFLVYGVFVFLVFLLSMLGEMWSFPHIVYGEQLNMDRWADFVGAGSRMVLLPFQANWISVLSYFPQALVRAIFRPWPAEFASWWAWPVALNVVWLPLLAIYSYRKRKPVSADTVSLRIGLFIAALLIFALVGYTTPVAGSLVRYRMPAMVLLILALCPPGRTPEK